MSRYTVNFQYVARGVAVALVLATTTACTTTTRFHGYAPTPQDLTELSVGQSSKDEVLARFGPPVSRGALGNNALYYASSAFKHYGASAPQEVDRQVVAIRFDANNVLSNVERYTLADGQVVSLDRRVTEDGINDVTFIGQLLGSFGRIDAGAFLGDE